MKQNFWLKPVCLILLAAVLAAGGFFAGKNTGKNEAQASFEAAREYDVLLHRSDLDGLGKIDGPVYVTGHRSPDSDTVGSSIACAALLTQLGYDAHAVVLGKINHETAYVLKEAGLEEPPLLTDATGKNMILVDHSEYMQSADGLRDANIIGIIDHHGDGSVTTGNQLIYDARPLGSTATILWIRYLDYGLEPDKKTATAMLGSILSDTKNLQPGAATFADAEAVRVLSGIAGITDVNAFWQKMFEESLSYEGMSEEEIFFSDYKEYESGVMKYAIGCVEAYDEAKAAELAGRMRAVMPGTLTSTGMDTAFAMVSVFHDDLSVSYLVPADEAAAEIIKIAFGDRAVFDGTSYVLNPGISRKRDMVPAITDVLSMYPGE